VRVGILLTRGKQLYDHIPALIDKVLVHETNFLESPVPSQKSHRSCICVLGVSILPLL